MKATAISTRGFLGMSSRNDRVSIRNIDLTSITLINMDVDSYRDGTELIDPSSDLYKQLASDMIDTH